MFTNHVNLRHIHWKELSHLNTDSSKSLLAYSKKDEMGGACNVHVRDGDKLHQSHVDVIKFV
jgi:hypothetical protein